MMLGFILLLQFSYSLLFCVFISGKKTGMSTIIAKKIGPRTKSITAVNALPASAKMIPSAIASINTINPQPNALLSSSDSNI